MEKIKFVKQCFVPVMLLTLLFGCNGSDNSTTVKPSINKNELTLYKQGSRHYFLSLPKDYKAHKSYRLLLAFHGSGSTAKSMQAIAQFEQYQQDYIIAYPQSAVEEWNEGCGCNKPARLGIDDLGYVDHIINEVQQNYAILPGEVYATGFSQGALFSQNLLCNRSEIFNGIASVAAPMSEQLARSCDLQTPTDYLLIQGTNDTVLPYQGLTHSNFGLISAPSAIELIASKNGHDSVPQELHPVADIVKLTRYQNEATTTQLISAIGGGHSWNHSQLDSSKSILDFFNQASLYNLPPQTSLYKIDNDYIQVRSMGLDKTGPAVVLISGPNKNFHSDSSWFSLVQPLLAQNYRVHIIDRPGNGWGTSSDNLGFKHFSTILSKTLNTLDEQEIILVSFASANISAKLLIEKPDLMTNLTIKHMIWIDPDILLPHSINLYQDYPVAWYREKEPLLLPHIEAGNWNELSKGKIDNEIEQVKELVPEHYQSMMDWDYFNQMSQRRLSIGYQLTRAKEIIIYHDDLNDAAIKPMATHIPITVIDTNFEQEAIDTAEENKDSLIQWQQEGSQWSEQTATQSGGQYIFVQSQNHLVTFDHPEVIVSAVEQAMK